MSNKTVYDLSGNNVPLVFPASGWTANADGTVSNTAGADPCSIGSGGQFNMAASPYDFIATYWMSIDATHLVSALAYMFHLAAAGPPQGQFSLFLGGASGRKPVTYVNNDSSGAISSDVSLDQPHMLAVYRSFSANTLTFYVDGAKEYTMASTATPTATSNAVSLAGTANRKTYRMSLVNLTESISVETAQGYNADAILNADAHIAREWNFCKGLIPAAPRTAFV
jgi:hypothetical protein